MKTFSPADIRLPLEVEDVELDILAVYDAGGECLFERVVAEGIEDGDRELMRWVVKLLNEDIQGERELPGGPDEDKRPWENADYHT